MVGAFRKQVHPTIETDFCLGFHSHSILMKSCGCANDISCFSCMLFISQGHRRIDTGYAQSGKSSSDEHHGSEHQNHDQDR